MDKETEPKFENGYKAEEQENPEYNLATGHNQLERGLKSRHIQFLALGGAIGTGLFVGSGSILSETGPAPLFMGYLSMILVVWCVMNVLAEMVTYLPMKGIGGLNHAINGAILTSAWSAGNSFLYSGSRVLYSMSLNKQAPKIFSITNKWGVPYVAVLFTWMFSLLAYLNVSNTGATVFNWFVNISTISGFIAWIVVMITYLRFRKAFEYNNMLHVLPYRTPLQPYATYAVLFVITLLTLTNGFQVFWPNKFNAADFLAAYITLPIFLVLYFGHKIYFRTPFAKKIEDIDVMTGKREMDELAEMEVIRVPKNWLQRAWFWLA